MNSFNLAMIAIVAAVIIGGIIGDGMATRRERQVHRALRDDVDRTIFNMQRRADKQAAAAKAWRDRADELERALARSRQRLASIPDAFRLTADELAAREALAEPTAYLATVDATAAPRADFPAWNKSTGSWAQIIAVPAPAAPLANGVKAKPTLADAVATYRAAQAAAAAAPKPAAIATRKRAPRKRAPKAATA